MSRDFGQVQLYIDTAYIREGLMQLGIDPWFGPVELLRPLRNLRIDGVSLTIRRTIFDDAVDHQSPAADEHVKYLDRLAQFEDTLVRLGTVRGTRNKRQKGVDMKLGTDMIRAARSGFIEYVALAAGDADFIPAVQEVQDLGPKVLVLAFEKSLSLDFILESDRYILLPENSDRRWAL